MAALHELSEANGLGRGMKSEVVFKLRLCRLDFLVRFASRQNEHIRNEHFNSFKLLITNFLPPTIDLEYFLFLFQSKRKNL